MHIFPAPYQSTKKNYLTNGCLSKIGSTMIRKNIIISGAIESLLGVIKI